MSKRKDLWVALSALSAAVPAGADAQTDRAGVTGSLNPAVTGARDGADARVLFVGSNVFRNETIRTDAGGLTHLMFLDQSSLTIGPNSEVVIDRFVYDPQTDVGELGLSATTGVLRFVGGSLSKRGNVSIKTPVGTLGIRGGVALMNIGGAGAAACAYSVYGALTGQGLGGASVEVQTPEHGVCLGPDGSVEEVGPISPEQLDQWLNRLSGPPVAPPQQRDAPLAGNYRGWLEQLAGRNIAEDMRRDEEFEVNVDNRDFDDYAS